jgi:hypothetical protein
MVIFHDQSGKNHICCSVTSFLSWSRSRGRQHACSLLCLPHIILTTVGKLDPESVEKSVEWKFGLTGRKIKRLCLTRWMFVEFPVQQDLYHNFLSVSGVLLYLVHAWIKLYATIVIKLILRSIAVPNPLWDEAELVTNSWLWPWYNRFFHPIEILKIISNSAYALGFSCDLMPLNMSGWNEESSHDVDIH